MVENGRADGKQWKRGVQVSSVTEALTTIAFSF